jgi:hypothetical protein
MGMVGQPFDLMVGVVERLGQEAGDMLVGRGIIGESPRTADVDESGEAQLGEVL